MPVKPLFALAVLSLVFLAGCSGNSGGGEDVAGSFEDEEAPEVQVTETTGGIRGVVVDDAIRPIKGAAIELLGGDAPQKTETNEGGLFAISGLKAGTYLVKASHPLYDIQQVSAEVQAGVKEPTPLKVLLTRQVFENPYMETLTFDGFIVCSANVVLPLLGGLLSEECGEGVGSPRTTCDIIGHPNCVANPVMPGQRIGGQGTNNVQYDFTVANGGIKTIIVEQVWKPTSEAGKAFYTPVSTEWSCVPFCGGKRIVLMEGPSPLLGRIDEEKIVDLNLTPAETLITTFTWASPETTPVGATLNQAYKVFVSNFYYVPAPEAWSFIAGSPDPFK